MKPALCLAALICLHGAAARAEELTPAALAPLPEDSVFLTGLAFQTDADESFALSQLRGKPTILAFAFTMCASTCPLTLKKLKAVKRAADARKLELQFVVVSVDPEKDTPASLANFRKHQRLDATAWHLLTGTVADTRLLAAALGFRFAKAEATGQVMHDNKVYLLDEDGRVKASVSSLDEDAQSLLSATGPPARR